MVNNTLYGPVYLAVSWSSAQLFSLGFKEDSITGLENVRLFEAV